MHIVPESLRLGFKKIAAISDRAASMADKAAQASLNGSFSGVSGLDQLGGGHGGVINGGAGSAAKILGSYAEQVNWLSNAMAATTQALTGQNTFVGHGMDLADEGGSVGTEGVVFPERPRPQFENFDFQPPFVTPALSLEHLSTEFTATKLKEAVDAAARWNQLSAEAAVIADDLHSVAREVADSNSGDVIDAAVEKIEGVAMAGETFAQNASIMQTSVERLAAIKSQGAHRVNVAKMKIYPISDPVQRMAAEQAFLQTFPATFSPFVTTGIPPIRNLMVMDGSGDGGGEIALGMEDIEGKGSKHNSTGVRPEGMTQMLHAATQAMGEGSFGTVEQGMDALSGVGAEGVSTTAANAATSALPAPPMSMPGGLGLGGGAPAAPAFGASGIPAAPLPMGGQRPSLGTMGTMAASASMPPLRPMMGEQGMGGAMGAYGMGRAGTAGASGGRGGSGPIIGGAGSGGVLSAVPGTGLAPTATPAGAVGTGASTRTPGTGTGRGMMPMMGAPMAGGAQQGKASGKVRTVTSAVEEDENLAALLGERAPVVPGVIGAWVRG
ncbi:hypothetical protein HCH15_03735 [Corynebacterium testudinoris]|nr:hypothetical protein [Corynebacterium testudinoris]MBX8995297.1 hypothetical protein [Corynebacterium testudinoris]